TQQTHIVQKTSEQALDVRGTGVFDGRDNKVFTGPQRTDGTNYHPIKDAQLGEDPQSSGADPGPPGYQTKFVQFIRSEKSSTKDNQGNYTLSRPFNADTFILLSPGKDGRYGNANDVANFDLSDK